MAPAQRRLAAIFHADALAVAGPWLSRQRQLARNQVHGGRLRMRPQCPVGRPCASFGNCP